MATQGLVTVIDGGRVLMKVVTGSDGYNAKPVADRIRQSWPCTAQEAYQIALDGNFGNKDSLVVMTDSEVVSKTDEDLSPRYRETFQQPQFNPRWPQGTAGYTEEVKV